MTTEPAGSCEAGAGGPADDSRAEADGDAGERYEVTLDRETCEGIFACLVRDGRFAEADDGLATLQGAESTGEDSVVAARFEDDRRSDAEDAAAACPVDAISVRVIDGE